MPRIAPKSTRVASVSQGKILYCENDVTAMEEQSKIFERAGYAVERTNGKAAAIEAFRNRTFDAAVLGHTLTKDERHHLAYMAKKSSEETQVLVLHASGKHPAVDFAIDSRKGAQAVLEALDMLVQQKSLAVAL
jgi:DNA-binding NtrC family response regulator